MRRRRGRKRAVDACAPAPVLASPNRRRTLDFPHDQLATGRRFRAISILDGVPTSASARWSKRRPRLGWSRVSCAA